MADIAKRDPLDFTLGERGEFHFHATGVEIKGRPSFGSYEGALEVAKAAFKRSGFWLADLLRYGDERTDWAERLSQVASIVGISEKRAKNIRAVGAMPASRRREGVEFGLHEEVAGLDPGDQVRFLEEAETNGYSRNELRQVIQGSKRRKVIEGQAVLQGKYRVWLCDYPWPYNDSGAIKGKAYGRLDGAYKGMPIEDGMKLPVAAHTHEHAVMFFFVTVPFAFYRPGPVELLDAWGFTIKTHRVWDKVRGLPSNYAQQITHELLLVATRGNGKPDVPVPHDPSIFRSRAEGEHSKKPNAELQAWIMKHWTLGPYCYLFASEKTSGYEESWDYFGNDARLWPQEASVTAGAGSIYAGV